jgi:hypothetical protein
VLDDGTGTRNGARRVHQLRDGRKRGAAPV